MAVDGEPAWIDFHRAGYLWLGSGNEIKQGIVEIEGMLVQMSKQLAQERDRWFESGSPAVSQANFRRGFGAPRR